LFTVCRGPIYTCADFLVDRRVFCGLAGRRRRRRRRRRNYRIGITSVEHDLIFADEKI